MTISAAFAEVLRGGRSEFNRRQAQARHVYAGIDDQAFLELLAGPVDAVVSAVAAIDAGATPQVVDSLYDVTLALLGQRWIGPGGRAPGIVDLWLALAQNAPQFIAQEPQRVLAALANAQVHWSLHGHGVPWSQTLIALAARATSVDALLRAGQVAAWRHGLAHYRESALERARQLTPELAAIAFGIGLSDWNDGLLEQLNKDRWFRPDRREPASRPYVAATVGAFVGFGGGFEAPPLASISAGELQLRAGKARFSLYADAFGATLQASSDDAAVSAQALPPNWRIEGGDLVFRGGRMSFADQGAITSAVARGDVLVLTHAYAHAATVLALPPW